MVPASARVLLLLPSLWCAALWSSKVLEMRTAALVGCWALLLLLHCGRGVRVTQEAGQTVNVTSVDTRPWLPIPAEDRAPARPDHEAYERQEVARALQRQSGADPRSRGGGEGPVKHVHEHQEDPGHEDFHRHLQAYLPHLSAAAVEPEQQRGFHDTEEAQRQYPLPLGNSVHAPYEPPYEAGYTPQGPDSLQTLHGQYRPHAADEAASPLHFGSNSPLPGGWSHHRPIPPKGASSHPYSFHAPSGPGPHEVIRPYHPPRGHTMGLLKKALNMLAAFIPLGLFLAALTPNVIHINSTDSDTSHRHRSTEGASMNDLATYPIFGLIEEYGYDSLDDPDCENRIFCEMSRLGSQPNGNVIQKGFWQLVQNTPEGMAESMGLKEVFHAVRTDSCDLYGCTKKVENLESSVAAQENQTEVAAASKNAAEKATEAREEKVTEELKVKT